MSKRRKLKMKTEVQTKELGSRNIFVIMKTQDEGVNYWTVKKEDGKSFDGPICGYNFDMNDWQLAIDCCKKLREKHGEN